MKFPMTNSSSVYEAAMAAPGTSKSLIIVVVIILTIAGVAVSIPACIFFRRRSKLTSKYFRRASEGDEETEHLIEIGRKRSPSHRVEAERPPTPRVFPLAEISPKPKRVYPKPSAHCPKDICKQYSIRNLQLDKHYFNFQYNQCYCDQCYPRTEIDIFSKAGSTYTAPRGWVRFGLQVDQAFADSKQIFRRWYTTFYGTSKDKLETILRNRFIPFPGDTLLSGETFTTHLPDKEHVYTSPSIYYASLRHICPKDRTEINHEWYDVQVVLECKQNPEGIEKQRGYRPGVCRIISDDEIEWKTQLRSSVVPYALLIRAKKRR